MKECLYQSKLGLKDTSITCEIGGEEGMLLFFIDNINSIYENLLIIRKLIYNLLKLKDNIDC